MSIHSYNTATCLRNPLVGLNDILAIKTEKMFNKFGILLSWRKPCEHQANLNLQLEKNK